MAGIRSYASTISQARRHYHYSSSSSLSSSSCSFFIHDNNNNSHSNSTMMILLTSRRFRKQQLQRRWYCNQQQKLPRCIQLLRYHHTIINTAARSYHLQNYYRTLLFSIGSGSHRCLSSRSFSRSSSGDRDDATFVGVGVNSKISTATTNHTHAFTTTSQLKYQQQQQQQQLRIAIVGGGAAGMTAALHLSPLVAAGLVCGPIDVYESSFLDKTKEPSSSEQQLNIGGGRDGGDGSRGGKQVYPGSGAVGRNIGVGIWSSAWGPFLKSLEVGISSSSSLLSDTTATLTNKVQKEKNRLSYRTLLQDLEACGSYVGNVGYRTPDGSWLVKSELNDSPFGVHDLIASTMMTTTTTTSTKKTIQDNEHHPALLFVREKDLLSCLHNAIQIESKLGTVMYHTGIRVDGITNVDGDLGALLLSSIVNGVEEEVSSTTNDSTRTFSPQYNLIIAADGLYSSLHSRFAGHRSIHATGGIGSSSSSSSSSSRATSFSSLDETFTVGYKWEHTQGQREATEVEDREYIVFRGNAPKLTASSSSSSCRGVDGAEDLSGVSFQTWGEKDSMRFAAVPFRHRMEDCSLKDDCDGDGNSDHNNVGRYSESQAFVNSKSKEEEEEVWFATISDPTFINEFKTSFRTHNVSDANRMKQMLLEAFGSWHQPIKSLIETTPSEEIMYEVAVAHRHSAGPVCDVGRILEFESWQATRNRSAKKGDGSDGAMISPHDEGGRINGRGPILVFIGDAMMTVDPVLAQGITIAMESGASIAQSIEGILLGQTTVMQHPDTTVYYHPKLLRDELLQRHNHRERRLLQLLRSTELVQRMAQPHGLGSTLFATWIVRPIIKSCPESLKRKVFDYMIRYSLGLTGNHK